MVQNPIAFGIDPSGPPETGTDPSRWNASVISAVSCPRRGSRSDKDANSSQITCRSPHGMRRLSAPRSSEILSLDEGGPRIAVCQSSNDFSGDKQQMGSICDFHGTPPIPSRDRRNVSIQRVCYAYHLLNRTASSEPPVAFPALYECAPTPASLPP